MPRKKRKDQRGDRRAVGYVRVSTVQQADEGLSLDAQKEKVEAYCKLRELELLTVYTDAGVSAYTPFVERPGGAEVAEALKSGVGNVVGLKLDRLFRNTIDCLNSVNEWDTEGVSFHLVDMGGQTVDTGSAMGKLFLTMMAGVAEWERNVISERTVMALQHKVAQGEQLGRAPYGSRWDTTKHQIKKDVDEAKLVGEILKLRGTGLSYVKIAQLLNRNGVPARGGQWHTTTIVRIVRREKTRLEGQRLRAEQDSQ